MTNVTGIGIIFVMLRSELARVSKHAGQRSSPPAKLLSLANTLVAVSRRSTGAERALRAGRRQKGQGSDLSPSPQTASGDAHAHNHEEPRRRLGRP
jgi:hypothetical protein